MLTQLVFTQLVLTRLVLTRLVLTQLMLTLHQIGICQNHVQCLLYADLPFYQGDVVHWLFVHEIFTCEMDWNNNMPSCVDPLPHDNTMPSINWLFLLVQIA